MIYALYNLDREYLFYLPLEVLSILCDIEILCLLSPQAGRVAQW